MCRLLGFAARGSRTVGDVLGREHSAVFQSLARLHRDGWGTAWNAPAGPGAERHHPRGVEALTSARSGWRDAALDRVLQAEQATSRLVHLRLATDGMAQTGVNTHPFNADGLAFAHHGSITPLGALEDLVSAERLLEVRGTTDSERYLAAIRTAMDAGLDPLDAVVHVVERIRAAYPRRSLNALLLTPDALIAVHANAGAPAPADVFRERGVGGADLPRHHDEAYYLMRIRRLEDGTVVLASTGMDVTGWQPLPEESVTRVDLLALDVETVLLGRSRLRPAA